jgi:outer membrane protein TolC
MRRILTLAFVVSAVAPVRAQELPPRLTLDDALRLARSYNPQYRQALNDLGVADAQQKQALGALLPTLSANLGFSGSNLRTLTGKSNYDEIIVRDDYVRAVSSNASQGLSLSMTLFDGGANLNRLREGRANARALEARVDTRTVQMKADVSARFYAALQAQHAVRVEANLLKSARAQFEMTRRRFEVGSARREDVLGAEAQLAGQEQRALQAEGQARKARLQLISQIGVQNEPDFELADELAPAFDPANLDADALVATALASSPRVREQQATLAARERSASAARGVRWPTITGSMSFSRSVGRPEYGAFFDLNPPNRSLFFQIGASLPLFNGFRTSYNVASADAQLANTREQLRSDKLALETEVRSALIDLNNAYRSLKHAERSLALSQERLELTEERYRVGGAVSFVELQNVIDGAARAEREAIDARFAFVNALISLEAKVGKEVGH